MITKTIIQIIKEKSLEIPHIQETFMHPEGADIFEVVNGKIEYKGTRVKKYPALIWSKGDFTSVFSDTGSNHREINFRGWVLVPVSNVENLDVFERILPDAVDSVIEKFDKGWNFGTIDGHRTWCRVASGTQGFTPEPKGRVAWEELQLTVRLGVSI